MRDIPIGGDIRLTAGNLSTKSDMGLPDFGQKLINIERRSARSVFPHLWDFEMVIIWA